MSTTASASKSTTQTVTPNGKQVEIVLTQDMMIHAFQGNLEEVITWLDDGGHVDARIYQPSSPIHQSTLLTLASNQGHEPIVEMLLKRGAAVDLQDVKGFTALMHAACGQKLGVARMLLRAGAALDVTDVDGMDAIQWGRWWVSKTEGEQEVGFTVGLNAGMPEDEPTPARAVLRLLTNVAMSGREGTPGQGASLDTSESSAVPAKIPAVMNTLELMRAIRHEEGTTAPAGLAIDSMRLPVHVAMAARDRDGEVNITDWLDGGGHVDARDWRDPPSDSSGTGGGRTLLMIASLNGVERIIMLMLSLGAAVDLQDQQGSTALMNACFTGNFAVAQRLLHAGARTDIVAAGGQDAKLSAIAGRDSLGADFLHATGGTEGQWDNVLELLRSYAAGKVNTPRRERTDTPQDMLPWDIGSAANDGKEAEVVTWLDGGGSINARAESDMTLLMVAAHAGHEPLVNRLLTRGADPNLVNVLGVPAMVFAADQGHVAIIRSLLQAGARTDGLRSSVVEMLEGHARSDPDVARVLGAFTLRKGKRVRLFGLAARPELNGAIGILQGDVDEATGRAPVRIVSPQDLATGKGIKVKVTNMIVDGGHRV